VTFHRSLPIVPLLLAAALSAQQGSLNSHQARRTLLDRVENLSPTDLNQITARAQAGDASAEYQLAFVQKDRGIFHSWMLKSAEQGYVPAECELGMSYLREGAPHLPVYSPVPKYAEADEWLRRAALAGDSEAQFWLGQGYTLGRLGSVDYHQALIWLRRAAAQRHSLAEYSLGQMYREGEGVRENDSVAASWFKKSADDAADYLEVEAAVTQLAYLYRDTELSRNHLEAYKWLVIIGSSLDPPYYEDANRAAKHLTKSQIAQGQRMARDWKSTHLQAPKEAVEAR